MTILVIDIGSSSVRALLYDQNARLIEGGTAGKKYHFNRHPPGAATFNMPELQQHVERVLDDILRHPAAHDIQVVGMDTFVGNVLGLDETGKPITPVYMYADTRSGEDVALLHTRVNPGAVHQRTGCIVHTAYHPARLHWLKRTQPETYRQVAQWVDIGTYLHQHWFGSGKTHYSVASWSGLLNRATLDWDAAWLELLGLERSVLPALVDHKQTAQGLRSPYAERWSALRDIPFVPALGDGLAANIGSGCIDDERIALTVGTTAAVRTITAENQPPIPPGLWGYRINHDLLLIGGATSEGGNIYQWLTDTLHPDRLIDLEDHLKNSEPDGHGLTLLPLLAGERSPGWAADASGALTGIRLSTTPLDIAQAALEGVALRLALITEQVAQLTRAEPTIVASGGSLVASLAWTQIIADALDRPLQVTAEPELTARGTAIMALNAIGGCALTDFPINIERSIDPLPSRAATLQAARQRQVSLYERLIANG